MLKKLFASAAVLGLSATAALAQYPQHQGHRPAYPSTTFVTPGNQQNRSSTYSSTVVTPGGQTVWDPNTYLPDGTAVYDPYDQLGHQIFIPGQNPIWLPPQNPWTNPLYRNP